MAIRVIWNLNIHCEPRVTHSFLDDQVCDVTHPKGLKNGVGKAVYHEDPRNSVYHEDPREQRVPLRPAAGAEQNIQ